MHLKASATAMTFVLMTAACGASRVPPAPPPSAPGTPHIGWVLMVGDRDNPNREFVCQSEPRTDCVIPVSRADQQTFADVHFFFHPGVTDTKYTGKIEIGFLAQRRSKPLEVTPNVTVKSGDPVGNMSVVGIVPSRPGRRNMTFAVIAQGGTTLEIRDRVRVQVK